jgi:hypothetical protein
MNDEMIEINELADMEIEKSKEKIERLESLVSALKQTNREQLELIDKLIRDCQILESEAIFYKDYLIYKGFELPERN